MSLHKKDILNTDKLEKIRQNLSYAELSDISDTEYSKLLLTQNKELLSILESNISVSNNLVSVSELFEVLKKSTHHPICIFNTSMTVIHQNDEWIKKFGNENSLQNIINQLAPEGKLRIQHAIQTSIQGEKPMIFTLPIHHLKNSVILFPIRSVNCSISSLMILFENKKQESENYFETMILNDNIVQEVSSESNIPVPSIYKTLLNAIDGFYFVADHSLIIKYVSSNFKNKLGYLQAEFIGKSLKSLIADCNTLEIDQYLSGIISGSGFKEKNENGIEVLLKESKGNLLTFELILTRYDAPEYPNGLFIGLCTDIQKKKEKEIELSVARAKAEENDKMKSDFLANMSHEIRTPLNGIIGFSSMLEKKDLSVEKREKYLHIIHASTHQLLTMVNDIIDISKIEASRLKIDLRNVDLHQVLDDLYLIFSSEKHRLEKDSLQLRKSFESSQKKFVMVTDEIRLKQVIGNLLSNAIKFTEKGEISFGYTLENKGKKIRFFVRDTGIGIPESKQNLIFGRYKQTDEGAKIKYKGTGLGLAISKGIVELLGGKIQVSSVTDKGSEFSFCLPYTAAK